MRDTGAYGVARAVSWLHANFSKPVQVEELEDAGRRIRQSARRLRERLAVQPRIRPLLRLGPTKDIPRLREMMGMASNE
jgi:hypothetical protein